MMVRISGLIVCAVALGMAGGCGILPRQHVYGVDVQGAEFAGGGVQAVFDLSRDRLMWFGPENGPNLLETRDLDVPPSDESYTFYGGAYTWMAPQSAWTDESGSPRDWPPDPRMDAGPVRLVRSWMTGIEVEGPVTRNGLREIKRFEMIGDGEMVVSYILRNDSQEPVTAGPWLITAGRRGGLFAVASGVDGSVRFDRPDSESLWLDRGEERGSWWLIDLWARRKWKNTRDDLDLKAFIDSPQRPVVAAWDGGWWLVRMMESDPLDPAAAHSGGEAPVEVYLHYAHGMGFFEAELLGRVVTLQPGESVEHRERWRVVEDSRPAGRLESDLGPLEAAVAAMEEGSGR